MPKVRQYIFQAFPHCLWAAGQVYDQCCAANALLNIIMAWLVSCEPVFSSGIRQDEAVELHVDKQRHEAVHGYSEGDAHPVDG